MTAGVMFMRVNIPAQAKKSKLPKPRRPKPLLASPPGSRPFYIVGIGASAGGLDACRKLMETLPAHTGMAFIIVQHLDPTHASMMVDLLNGHGPIMVSQAAEGMLIETDHIYVIPPGTYLSVSKGILKVSQPRTRDGARLPFDFLLHSLADEYAGQVICVILSGTLADGSLGLKAVKKKGGFVIVQDPEEATYDGMPRSAIMTGVVDRVLPVAQIADAIIEHAEQQTSAVSGSMTVSKDKSPDWLSEIISLLRMKTPHDFRFYKEGTLQRRIERRMGLAGLSLNQKGRYLDRLRSDANELDLLAKDLLINVTGFFRDVKVFDLLAQKIIPELVRDRKEDQPLRIWIAGCSTGEETYSLAMLFHEEIVASNRNIKLQVFASDVDPDAVSIAREGLYPETIETNVSAARLARFFSKEGHSYKVLPELRAAVVFTVQDVLADPPFSRLDLVSCRNLLIYLHPDAQAKAIALFHFALREGGILLLGSSETIGNADDRFEVLSKSERLYRHVGRSRPGDLSSILKSNESVRLPIVPGQTRAAPRQSSLAEVCRRAIMEAYAPAAVLINQKHECVYFLGPTERYLRLAPGPPTYDLLTMAREGIRMKLLSAIQQATQDKKRVVITGGKADHEGKRYSFSIAVQPVQNDGEELLLICFVDEPGQETGRSPPVSRADLPRIAVLEQELESTRTELQEALRNLEFATEEQKAVSEEALSVNEEFQSTNEELLTSKEELQSLNEELTALNSQLQETLERQRTTSNDLQNVLYSTDVATLFLDSGLNIRFYTPATKSLFNIISSDIGRPLADLHSLAADSTLLSDAESILKGLAPVEREIQAQNGASYIRRILPYRTQDNGVKGVVITFVDNTERRRTADALETAMRQAERATVAKSLFLAAASHDLRQPLQTLTLLQGLLVRNVESEKAKNLVHRLDETLGAMTSMLNTLLDINQIEAGTIHVEKVNFPIDDLLSRLKEEFVYLAQAQMLVLRVVPCRLVVHSDPHLLEQMIRNLLSNALKYTQRGKVLLGCRRHGEHLSIEIWDTGVGIPKTELESIFEEYHQIGNTARERSRGLGLGLSIVQRLGNLLEHPIRVQSYLDKGSMFSIGVAIAQPCLDIESPLRDDEERSAGSISHNGMILIIEDEPEVRDLLKSFLKEEGYHVATAPDGVMALELVKQGIIRPDLILADYNLPNGMSGLLTASKLRVQLHIPVPIIILTGDISTAALRDIAGYDCIQLNKPVKLPALIKAIHRLLPKLASPLQSVSSELSAAATIFIVDDDSNICEGMRAILERPGRSVEIFSSSEAFLKSYRPGQRACLLIDAYLPGMGGLDLLKQLMQADDRLPAIMITGHSDVAMAVQAMKAGALDYIEKPMSGANLIASVELALENSTDESKDAVWREDAKKRIAGLTLRQRQIMDLILAGHPNKNIAMDLGISQRTVENHRATIMSKTGSKSLPALARLAFAAAR